MTTHRMKSARTGTLRIGNQWNAINIIARSQTHPLKAICELTENAIDAKAGHIHILRRRSQGEIYVEVLDDGQGVPSNEEGEPDFGRIATHVCDSMKRQLSDREREGVHGEFGIGLLSFWSLGEQLRMIAPGRNSRLFEMRLVRGERSYLVRAVRGTLALSGTRVVVGPLLPGTRKVVTGEKLNRYLSTELRDRIRSSGVQIRVIDKVSRKEGIVQPREFPGERLTLPHTVATSCGNLTVELYFRDNQGGSGETGVAVCKDGTRVLKDITELIQFQHVPWTEGRIEGVLDFAMLNLAPGNRSGIVPDEKFDVFVQAAQTLEASVLAIIAERDQAESDKASRDILRQVHKAFVNALRQLPSNEYLFFDIPEPATSLQKSTKNTNGEADGPTLGLRLPALADARDDSTDDDETPIFIPLDPGPLAAVRITPRHARRKPGERCQLVAKCYDEHHARIVEGIDYQWRVGEGEAELVPHGDQATAGCDHEGQATIEVLARQGELEARDQVVVKFLDRSEAGEDDATKGLPSYRLDPEHGKPWRSRYDAKHNEIVINSAHRDFLSSKTTGAKHRRYIGKLYAKEVVLINFPHESPSEVMERLIELTLRTEDVL